MVLHRLKRFSMVEKRINAEIAACQKIVQYALGNNFNEAGATSIVIDVFEKLLGYDKYKDIKPQESVGRRQKHIVDLLLQVENMLIPVEVKASSVLTEVDVKQLEDYCKLTSVNTKFGILTNAVQWELWKFERDQRHIVVKVDFSKDDVSQITERMYFLSKEAMQRGQTELFSNTVLYPEAQYIVSVLLTKKVLAAVRNQVKQQYSRTIDEQELTRLLEEEIVAEKFHDSIVQEDSNGTVASSGKRVKRVAKTIKE